MLIFKKKSICIKASSDDVLNTLKKIAHKPSLFNSFTKDSFSFTMWERHEYGRMYGALRFFGTIKEHGDECAITYSIWPGKGFIVGLIVFLLAFLYGLTLSLFSTSSLLFTALTAAASLIMIINLISQENSCDERLYRKLHELENKSV